ncbi:MAG: RNA polymerase sigma factor [Planctomycetota bacterium]
MPVSPSTALRYEQSDPDVRLMLRVRDDDAGAYEQLMRRYENRLMRFMQHMSPRIDMAEDLMQDTFLRVYRARKNYVPGAKFSTYLFTIAGNVVRNAKRTLSRRHEISESDVGTRNDGSRAMQITSVVQERSTLMPVRIAEQDERAGRIREAVDRLSDRQKMALLLSKFEGLSYAEIAESMSLTTKAVKSLLSRARVNLKEILDAEGDIV